MADVTGPISTLSGASHAVPDGMACDQHPDRPAVVRIQGETDSFGCEMHDICQECLDSERAARNSPEAAEWRKGTCEWCKNPADDLRDRRDYEEGSCGRVYRVCGACVKRDNEYWAAEAAAYDDDRYDDYDDGKPRMSQFAAYRIFLEYAPTSASTIAPAPEMVAGVCVSGG
jgi:hypothetical protein